MLNAIIIMSPGKYASSLNLGYLPIKARKFNLFSIKLNFPASIYNA
jgi:hypothetical protein